MNMKRYNILNSFCPTEKVQKSGEKNHFKIYTAFKSFDFFHASGCRTEFQRLCIGPVCRQPERNRDGSANRIDVGIARQWRSDKLGRCKKVLPESGNSRFCGLEDADIIGAGKHF